MPMVNEKIMNNKKGIMSNKKGRMLFQNLKLSGRKSVTFNSVRPMVCAWMMEQSIHNLNMYVTQV
jgi:hypothetical protein